MKKDVSGRKSCVVHINLGRKMVPTKAEAADSSVQRK